MKYLVLAVALLAMSCESEIPKKTFEEIQMEELSYSLDQRTGLCFASRYAGTKYAVMSNVPCTPEVERLIKGGEK